MWKVNATSEEKYELWNNLGFLKDIPDEAKSSLVKIYNELSDAYHTEKWIVDNDSKVAHAIFDFTKLIILRLHESDISDKEYHMNNININYFIYKFSKSDFAEHIRSGFNYCWVDEEKIAYEYFVDEYMNKLVSK